MTSAGAELGSGSYEEDPVHVTLRCRVPGQAGLCKLWLKGPSGETLLGTPTPQGAGLVLTRTLSRSGLTQAGAYPPLEVEVRPVAGTGGARSEAGTAWCSVTAKALRFPDPLLEKLAGRGEWSFRTWDGGILLRHPWQENAPFPAVPLFCLTRVTRGEQGLWVFLWLDRNLRHCPPQYFPSGGGEIR